jgi:hypothetical protein
METYLTILIRGPLGCYSRDGEGGCLGKREELEERRTKAL